MSNHDSFFQKFACVYGTHLSKQQREEVAEFAVKLAQAVTEDDGVAIADLIKQAAWQINDLDYAEAFLGFCQQWLDEEEDLTKQAAPMPSPGTLKAVMAAAPRASESIKLLGAGVGLALAAKPIISEHLRKRQRDRNIMASMNQIVQENPSLRPGNDPNVPKYFRIIKNFAPDVAADPLLAANVMREMQTYGPEGLTTSRVKDLLGLQREYTGYQVEEHKPFGELGRAVSQASGTASDAYSQMERRDDALLNQLSSAGRGRHTNPYAQRKGS